MIKNAILCWNSTEFDHEDAYSLKLYNSVLIHIFNEEELEILRDLGAMDVTTNKNGFLKRLPYNEKKSSALAKLMKSDRYWVVFSIHDDVHPFLELWHEPTEVATKPPVYIFPLVACQHISPSIIPADNEWSFVINFDTVAIRFSCNSREVMEDWVDVIR